MRIYFYFIFFLSHALSEWLRATCGPAMSFFCICHVIRWFTLFSFTCRWLHDASDALNNTIAAAAAAVLFHFPNDRIQISIPDRPEPKHGHVSFILNLMQRQTQTHHIHIGSHSHGIHTAVPYTSVCQTEMNVERRRFSVEYFMCACERVNISKPSQSRNKQQQQKNREGKQNKFTPSDVILQNSCCISPSCFRFARHYAQLLVPFAIRFLVQNVRAHKRSVSLINYELEKHTFPFARKMPWSITQMAFGGTDRILSF